MSASKRAIHKVLRKVRRFIGPDISLPDSGEMASVIAAEYAPLIKAAKEISRRLADPELSVTYMEEDALNKALAHIEGDATP